jgi:hypothetical protein
MTADCHPTRRPHAASGRLRFLVPVPVALYRQQALAADVFGSPAYVLDGEVF